MASIQLCNISKVYRSGVKAVSNLNLDIKDKELVVIVGTSGCGKSATLRMIAGLEDITAGELYIDGNLVNGIVPKERDIAMIFQDFALFPHLKVYDNIAFGLKLRKTPKQETDEKVNKAARLLGVEQYLLCKPKALSSAEKLRVALCRAIVREPKIILLDEPLCNLDARQRLQMRTEIKKLQNKLGITIIYATHDQTEAMTMGTRVVVMKDGFLQQIDLPQNIYDYPVNKFVAGYMGIPQMNFFEAFIEINDKKISVVFGNNRITLPDAKTSKIINLLKLAEEKIPVILGIRPEDIHDEEVFLANSPETVIQCKIDMVEKMGSDTLLYCNLDLKNAGNNKIVVDTGATMIARVDPRTTAQKDEVVKLAFDAQHIHLFLKENETSLLKKDDAFAGNLVPAVLWGSEIKIGSKTVASPLSAEMAEKYYNGEVLVKIGNDDIELNAKGADAIEAKIDSIEQIGYKKYLTLNLNYSQDENADKTPKSVFINVPTSFEASEGAVIKVAIKSFFLLDAETREEIR